MNTPKKLIIAGIALLAFVTLSAAACSKPSEGTAAQQQEALQVAEWLTQNNVKMYGAFWCPHCSDQKEIFGAAAFKKVNYIECSLPDRSGQTQVCKDANITSYPTWEFTDGSRLSDVLSLQELKERTNFPDAAGPQPVTAS